MALYLFVKRTTPLTPVTPLKHVANFGIFSKTPDYKSCYKILEIEETSDQEQIRAAYLTLVKKYHPDSGTEDADVEKFKEIDKAFRILTNKKSKERRDIEEAVIIDTPDIKHTAPQHRQSLSYDGVGSGNPFQRQKQFTEMRARKAAENVYEHRVAKASADDTSLLDKNPLKHKIKTMYGFDRLVEDLIQESMSKGDFSNLKGYGKPLPTHQNRNPYVDFITHKINEVLIDNGFTPEWITMQKEIKKEANRLRNDLIMERQYFGPYPLSVEENIEWSNKVYQYRSTVEKINKKINKFNLVVPVLNKQMLHVSLESEAQKAMINGKSCEDLRPEKYVENPEKPAYNLFNLIDYFFKGK